MPVVETSVTSAISRQIEAALARATVAENESLEQARINGIGAEREASLLGSKTRLERVVLKSSGAIDDLLQMVEDAYNEGYSDRDSSNDPAKSWEDSNVNASRQKLIEWRERQLSSQMTSVTTEELDAK